jgi:shikimate kinase
VVAELTFPFVEIHTHSCSTGENIAAGTTVETEKHINFWDIKHKIQRRFRRHRFLTVLSAQNGPSEQAEVKKTAVAFFCAQKMACVLLGGGILNHTRRALRTHVIMTFQILINRNS